MHILVTTRNPCELRAWLQAALAALSILVPSTSIAATTVEELRAQYDRHSADFAAAAPHWRPDAPGSGSLLFIAPDEYSEASSPGGELREVRGKYAESLFALAKEAAAVGQTSLAFQWATEAVRENPDHADARRVLGFEQHGQQWLTNYGVKMLTAGKTWNAKFGWIAADDLPRYEKGERPLNGYWVSSKADAARHTEIKAGWQVHTDHFLVTTNYSLESATELAARLERLFQVWRQLFAGFYMSNAEVASLFAGTGYPRVQTRPFRVYLYRDREHYITALRTRQPRIEETLGIYFDTTHEAFFFAGDDKDRGTLYHEVVHQLFQESKTAARHIGYKANFWVIEGVATYFETLTEHDDPKMGLYFTVGESTKGRLPAARDRLKEQFFIPLAELAQQGKNEFQRPEDIAKRYSQSCGLAAFLIDGNHGRYREPLVRYLQAVYAGHDNDQSLATATGKSFEELDTEYRHHLESLP